MATYAPGETIANARHLRKTMSPPEARLWVALRGRQLSGLKFRRQHPVGAYILDFFCPALRLAVRMYDMGHMIEEHRDRDHGRGRCLARAGIQVLRIPAWAV